MSHSVKLEPFKSLQKSRHACPSCQAKGEFTRYIYTETGNYVGEEVGRCNRDLKCGYHLSPKEYFEQHPELIEKDRWNVSGVPPLQTRTVPGQVQLPVDLLPVELHEQTMRNYHANHFFLFLVSLFGELTANYLTELYFIGTSKKWPGANIFWQIDVKGNLRQAKVMLYDPLTGRRVKDQGDKVHFAGKSILKNPEANLLQCFFGEVLLTMYPEKKVGLVESEKTAMVAAAYFPQLIWLATGGSHGCKWTTPEVCKALDNRQVILFPDLNFFDKWSEKAEAVRKHSSCQVVVSDLLETNSTDEQRSAGWDLADFLLLNRDPSGWALTTAGYPLFWDLDLTPSEDFNKPQILKTA